MIAKADNDNPLKISFCITCRGRLDQLQETLGKNLVNNSDYPNTEFVVLDYDSRDGLQQWMKENFSAEIESGKIRYAHYVPAEHWKMGHAKNLSHRLATGDVVCTLDADNITAPGYASWLNETFTKNPDAIVRPSANNLMRKMSGAVRLAPGTRGRIAMSRANFNALTGYDESITGHGYVDNDLFRRAMGRGLQRVELPDDMVGTALDHTAERRIQEMSPDDQEKFRLRMQANSVKLGGLIPMKKVLKLRDQLEAIGRKANPSGLFGMVESNATLTDINGHEITLDPITTEPPKLKVTPRRAGGGNERD